MELLSRHSDGVHRAHRLPAVALLPPPGRGPPRRRPRPRRRADPGLRRRSRSTSSSSATASPSRRRPTRGSSGSPGRSAARWSRPPTSTTCGARTTTTTPRCSACRPSRRSRSRSCSFDTNEFFLKSPRGDGGVASPSGPRRSRRPSRSPSAARSRWSSASCCCRRYQTPDGSEPRRDAARLADRGPAPALRRPASRPRPASGSTSSSA